MALPVLRPIRTTCVATGIVTIYYFELQKPLLNQISNLYTPEQVVQERKNGFSSSLNALLCPVFTLILGPLYLGWRLEEGLTLLRLQHGEGENRVFTGTVVFRVSRALPLLGRILTSSPQMAQ